MNILISYRMQLYKLKTSLFFAFNLISGFYESFACVEASFHNSSFYGMHPAFIKIPNQQRCVSCDDGENGC